MRFRDDVSKGNPIHLLTEIATDFSAVNEDYFHVFYTVFKQSAEALVSWYFLGSDVLSSTNQNAFLKRYSRQLHHFLRVGGERGNGIWAG